jgi:RNase H-like domain found in reverse transcriptase/Reverse transcriptase (RNA-dependent DNA polymerase)/Integrase zinc binding domain
MKNRIFLIDTGASVSLLSQQAVLNESEIEPVESSLRGFGGKQKILGKIFLSCFGKKILFYVLEKLPLKVHGILGANFLKMFKANIDYGRVTITLQRNGSELVLPMHTNKKKGLELPARCEVFRLCKVNQTEDCITLPEEVSEGIFVAGSLVSPKKGTALVKFMNTRDEDVEIFNFAPKLLLASEVETKVWSKDNKNANPDRVCKLFDELKLDHLNASERKAMKRVCAKYADVFHLEGDKLTSTNIYRQPIRLKTNATPVYVKPYRLPYSQKQEIDRQINEMIRNDIIEEARSEWSSPILVVPKKADEDGIKKWRVVVDYRRLNEKIQDDKFPLANISDILDSLGRAIYFSTLDLSQGYYQVEIDKKDRPCTAFVTDRGQYQMKKLPMGLKISPSAFSRLMTIAMAGLNYEQCFVYLDDVIVFGSDLETHNRNLTAVLERLREVKLKLNPKKSKLLGKEVLYLGHNISAKGIAPDPEKIGVVKDYPVPKNADETKRFVAFANYYRKFIRNFSRITEPLNRLSRKNVPFVWSCECQKAFEMLRKALYSSEVLDFPDFSPNNTFVLTTDGSRSGLGAVLSNGNGRAIAYASRALNSAEKNYSVTEIELLGNVWAVKHFRPYLFGRQFEIRTDHRPLVYLFSQVDPSSRLNKFRMVLQEFDFTVVYIKGKDNVVADALSRIHVQELRKIHSDTANAKVLVVTRSKARAEVDLAKRGSKPAEVASGTDSANVSVTRKTPLEADRSDQPVKRPTMCRILKRPERAVEVQILGNQSVVSGRYVASKSESLWFNKKARMILVGKPNTKIDCESILSELPSFCRHIQVRELVVAEREQNRNLIESLGYVRKQLEENNVQVYILSRRQSVHSDFEKRVIMNDFHVLPTGGHAGVTRMMKTVQKHYTWPGLAQDVKEYVKSCEACQRFKYQVPAKEPMVVTTTATEALSKVFLDLIGPFPKDEREGWVYALTIQCELSKYLVTVPLRNKEASTVARALVENFILIFGIPECIATDCGTEFLAEVFKETAAILKIRQLQSTAYHHESIGALENTHKHAAAFFRSQIAEYGGSWGSWLSYWSFAYNTTEHTQTGYTPHELVFGKICMKPNNLTNSTSIPIYNPENYRVELQVRLQKAWEDARKNLIRRKQARKLLFDKDVRIKEYQPGDKVLLKKENRQGKLDDLYIGPFEVVKSENPNVELKIRNRTQLVHKNRVKPFIAYYELDD